jgi:hypothetical protein
VAVENPESTAEEQPAGETEDKSLHDILAEAYDEAEGAVAEETEGAEAPAVEGEGEAASDRDKRGRFKSGTKAKTGEPAEGDDAAAAAAKAAKDAATKAAPAVAAAEQTPEQKAAAAATLDAPANWAAPDKAMLADLQKQNPRAAQWLLDRHKAMEADHTRKTTAIAEFRKEYEPVHQMFVPWRDKMQAAGYTPSTLIKAWASVEQDLTSGDPGKQVGVIQRMVQMYKLPVDQVAAALGINSRAAAPGADPAAAAAAAGKAPGGVPEISEAMAPWVKELAAMRDWRRQVDTHLTTQATRAQEDNQSRQTADFQRIGNEIEVFRTSADKDGKTLLHPYFDEVERDMSTLAQLARARGEKRTLTQLYDDAVWANPSVREKKLAADQSAQRVKADAEARAKAAQARKAGSSVTGGPNAGQSPRPQPGKEQTLRESLDAAYDDQTQS